MLGMNQQQIENLFHMLGNNNRQMDDGSFYDGDPAMFQKVYQYPNDYHTPCGCDGYPHCGCDGGLDYLEGK